MLVQEANGTIETTSTSGSDRAVQSSALDRDATQPRRSLIDATRPFARAHDGIAAWQLITTLVLYLGTLLLVSVLDGHPLKWLLLLPLIGLITRLFVLQHDCGHRSLFRSRRLNDAVGILLSVFSGVAYEAWRTEHNWHHSHQGKLSHRGVDRMNSPMTKEEAIAKPDKALVRARKISARNVFVLGAISLLILRKHHSGFFPFRENFRWRIRDRAGLIRSVRMTNVLHGGYHVATLILLGPLNYLTILLPMMFVGAGFGSLLFWVQHNFERTYHADDADWRFTDVGVKGSSYLKLPALFDWFTASIGLHHVHHLNSKIPNYRLEEARKAIPELTAVQPLSGGDLRKCFTHVYWDGTAQRMVTLADVRAASA